MRKSGVQFVMGFQTRHATLVRRARDWVPNPRVVFGQIIVARWEDASWARRPQTGGGNVLSQGVPGFDLLAHLADVLPRALFAEGGTITHDPATTEVVDTVLATPRLPPTVWWAPPSSATSVPAPGPSPVRGLFRRAPAAAPAPPPLPRHRRLSD